MVRTPEPPRSLMHEPGSQPRRVGLSLGPGPAPPRGSGQPSPAPPGELGAEADGVSSAQPKGKKAKGKKVAPAPAVVKKQEAKKVVNPLFEKRPKNFGIGE